MVPNKACPVVFHDSRRSRILVFRHPSAGIQLIKGGIEPREEPHAAALRELREESGIADAVVSQDLGLWDAAFDEQIWSLHLCATAREFPERWSHRCLDYGSVDLTFFWHDFDADPTEEWHPLFRRALACIRSRIRRSAR